MVPHFQDTFCLFAVFPSMVLFQGYDACMVVDLLVPQETFAAIVSCHCYEDSYELKLCHSGL